ncbi:hypothetical protein [Desulfovibrio sp. TomC]|uniref:hypothetical protein n=1 Tax=Desulfovibrio sp. TomC TaxID=1562888 RepID=UPI00057378AD|nr:hypothetical protein [Desulfovibrio sp. TomC]KHK03290.1 hypothetical protein NY78_1354 [Desulfovibrio sp. TomC]
MEILRFVALATVVVLGCFGCAIKNEGAIYYRKTVSQPVGQTSKAGGSDELVFAKKYALSGIGNDTLSKDDTISIFLNHACIASFAELPNVGQLETSKTTRGEIAIVAKVTEMATSTSMDFTSKASDAGRLVYYNDDVRRHQPLNLSFLPIYGPQKYNGHPLAIQLYILELDEGNKEQYAGLLGTLAGLGSTINPAAAPILGVLEKLGTAFLQGNRNDIIFRYHFILLPEGNSQRVAYPVLEAGNYVLIRKENRQTAPNWDAMRYDQGSGLVHCLGAQALPADAGCVSPQNCDDTYLTLTILKNVAKDTNITEAAKTLSEFITAEYAESQGLKGVKEALDGLKNLQIASGHQARLDDLNAQLRLIGSLDSATNRLGFAQACWKLVNRLDKEITATARAESSQTTTASDTLKKAELEAIITKTNALKCSTSTVALDTFNAGTLLKEIQANYGAAVGASQ